jgi:hypothetical protein
MLCSAIANSTHDWTTRTTAASSETRTTPPSGSGYSTSAPFGYAASAGLPGPEPGLPSAKTSQPRAHLLLNKGRGTKVFYTVLFRTLDSFFIFSFSFFYFSTFFYFCVCNALAFYGTCTVLHFYISLSLHAHLLLSNAKQPRRKGEISYLIF